MRDCPIKFNCSKRKEGSRRITVFSVEHADEKKEVRQKKTHADKTTKNIGKVDSTNTVKNAGLPSRNSAGGSACTRSTLWLCRGFLPLLVQVCGFIALRFLLGKKVFCLFTLK
jgi:hypothetical protein